MRGRACFLRTYPASRHWLRLPSGRLGAIAALYHAATQVARADSHGKPARVDHYRQDSYDILLTLGAGRWHSGRGCIAIPCYPHGCPPHLYLW